MDLHTYSNIQFLSTVYVNQLLYSKQNLYYAYDINAKDIYLTKFYFTLLFIQYIYI